MKIEVTNVFSAWLSFTRNAGILYNWDSKPIQLRTDAEETKRVVIMTAIADLEKQPNGIKDGPSYDIVVSWRKNSDGLYGIQIWYHHISEAEENMQNVPEDTDKVWTLFKLKRKLVIECNGIKVFELQFKDLFDQEKNAEQRSIKGWSKTSKKITFDSLDTSTLGYRPAGKKSTFLKIKFVRLLEELTCFK